MKKTFLLFSFILILSQQIYAQAGTNDPTFNTLDDGTFGDGSGFNQYVLSTAIQADGKIIVGGGFATYNGAVINCIARLNVDGSLDLSFNPAGTGLNGYVTSIAIQSDSKIIIGGNFTSFNGITRNRIARLNANGSLDYSFNPGTGFYGANYSDVESIAIQSDGKIIVGGWFDTFNGTAKNRIVRLNTNGTLDTSFSTGTGFSTNRVTSIIIKTDGKIIVGGDFSTYNGSTTTKIARLNANGTLDTTFNIGTGFDSSVESMIMQADGKIMVGGWFSSFNGSIRNKIARLNSDGTLDSSFNPGSGITGSGNFRVESITIQADGKIIAGGEFTFYNGTTSKNIVRLNTDGTLDIIFNSGSGFNLDVFSIDIQADGKIIVGGSFFEYKGNRIGKIARLNADGTLDTGFNFGIGFNVATSLLFTAIQTDGKIVVGGDFSSFYGITRNRIARLNADGTLDINFNPGTGFDNDVYSITIQSDGKIIVGGWFSSFNGTARKCIARLNVNGTLDTSFNPGTGFQGAGNNYVNSITIQADGKIIVGGSFTSYNGTARSCITRLNTDGTLDTSFNPATGFNGEAMSIAIQPDGKMVIGGNFTSFDGITRNRIARLNTDGSLDTSFNPGTGFSGWVRSISIQSDGKIIAGGSFSAFNTISQNEIARLNSDGSLDTSFNTGIGFNSRVLSTVLQANGKIVVGGWFTSFNGMSRNGIARLNTDGSLDINFNPGTGFSIGKMVWSISLQADDKIIVGGEFSSFNGISRNRIARLNGDCSIPLNLTTGINGNIIIVNEIGASYQWINCSNNQPINGATSQNYTAISNGNYACIVTKNGCGDTTACVNINSVGIDYNDGDQIINIYPNPNNGQFTITTENIIENTSVIVYNSLGEAIYQQKVVNKTEVINSNLSIGVYLLKVISDKGITTKKIVINK